MSDSKVTKVVKSSKHGAAKGERRGGRAKGTPNKATKNIQDMLRDMNCDPIEGLARLAVKARAEGDDKFEAQLLRDLSPYFAPKLTAGKLDTTVTEKTHEERLQELLDDE